MQMMEQMSILFDCVRRAAPQEAQLLSEILPQVSLSDYHKHSSISTVENSYKKESYYKYFFKSVVSLEVLNRASIHTPHPPYLKYLN